MCPSKSLNYSPADRELLSFLSTLKKAELHAHLEGTVDLELLGMLARKNRVALDTPTSLSTSTGRTFVVPPPMSTTLSRSFAGSFSEFIRLYVKISSCIQSAEDLVLIARRYARSAADESVVHAELYVSATTLLALGLSEPELFAGLREAEAAARNEGGVELRWIFDIVRNSGEPGELVLEIAKRAREAGVRIAALGIAGLEDGFPASAFRSVFGRARDDGFRVLAHAGETAGAESVRDTLDALRPDRIGHGVRALEDTELVAELAARAIPIEVCPVSNVALGISPPGAHPVKQMLDVGLRVVLASDDPGIFGKTLDENYLAAARCGVSRDELEKIAADSLAIASAP